MLVTRQNKIPFLWLIMLTLPWVLFYFMIQVNGVNFFILNRLIENPAALTFFFSLPGLLLMFIPLGPYISFMSDRIWTRWGRRKPFLIINFTAAALVLFLYPLAPNVWVFLALMCVAAVFGCFGTPFESLKLEIIPPDMRGRSAAMNTWVCTILNIVFNLAVIGRFDEVMPYFGRELSGIKILYWSAGAALLVVVFNYFFGIHEVNPKSTITGEKFSFRGAWKAMTMPQLRYLYVFMLASTLLNASLGSLGTLLYINQWGYSFQEMGVNIAVGGIINLFLIPLIGLFADKGQNHRMRVWIGCIVVVKILMLAYFAYVTWYLPDQRPTLVEIIFFGEVTCIVGIVAGMVYYPLVYDYIPRNLMGTYTAGCGILSGIFSFLITNGLGLFLLGWARLFQPPAGEMVRVCLAREMSSTEVVRLVNDGPLAAPAGGTAAVRDVVAVPWYANGIVKDSGTCYEIRLRDDAGVAKMKRRDELKKKIDKLDAKLQMDRKAAGSPEALAERERELSAMRAEQAALSQALDQSAAAWRNEVERCLGATLIQGGNEVLATNVAARAVVATVPTTRKATEREVDRLNRLLWAESPTTIGLGAERLDRSFALSWSALLPEGQDPNELARTFCLRLRVLAETAAPGLLARDAVSTTALVRPAAVMDLALVEDPARIFVSPITRAMNAVLSRFIELPLPDQKLVSLSRNACKDGPISHARAAALTARNGLHLIVVTDEQVVPDARAWIAEVVAKMRTECASLKLTVPEAVLDQGVVPVKYNYMSGYLYVFVLVLIGFGLVMYFVYQEKIGVVRKWGAEEARAHADEQEKAIALARAAAASAGAGASERATGAAAEIYVPGYLMPKVLGACLGLAVIALAIGQAWPDLRLLVAGRPIEAMAVSVVVTKPGQPETILRSQADLLAKTKAVASAKDYTWTFYNEFAFETPDGQAITFRRPVGCKLKPIAPLLDDNGLPSTVAIRYDPMDPARTVFPREYSTWLAPFLTAFLGLITFVLCAILAWFARKPIVLSTNAAVNLTAKGG